jgi:chromate transporter
MVITFFFFKTPWVFPILLLCGGIATNFSDKRIPEKEKPTGRPIRWTNLLALIAVFVLAGFFSETARKNEWKERKAFNLFENFYRFGSIVFGGGDVLLPMMLDQYVVRPNTENARKKNPDPLVIEKAELLTGYGLVRAMPGPVFSVSSFMGGVLMKGKSVYHQVAGCCIATIAIFMPSVLMVLFFFPVWQYLKKYVVVFRALEGINAVVVGFMWAGALFLLKDMMMDEVAGNFILDILFVVLTAFLLYFTKIPTPLLVIAFLLMGYFSFAVL